MACKVSTGSFFGRLFQSQPNDFGDRQTLDAQALCGDLSESLSAASLSTSGNDRVRASLQSVISALETPTISGESSETDALLKEFIHADLPARMLEVILDLDFEARKDVMRLFGALLRLGTPPVVEYVCCHPQILQMLLDGCGNPEVALHNNMMLRSCARDPKLLATLLEEGFTFGLMKLAHHETFFISSDAFSSLRELLLTHKAISSQYLEAYFHEFFSKFNELLQVDDYVTKRQALRLLGEILLDRSFMKVMLAYVGNEQYLQIHMNLLREDSKVLQVDAFHVFKIFAANPKKPQRVHQILFRNRDRLIKLIDTFKPSNDNDKSFMDDRVAVVNALKGLEAPRRSKSPPRSNSVDGN